MINLQNPDLPPSGGATAERDYWKVGSGLPEDGSAVGYDLRWLDADNNVIGERIVRVDGSVPIPEAEYDALIAQWVS